MMLVRRLFIPQELFCLVGEMKVNNSTCHWRSETKASLTEGTSMPNLRGINIARRSADPETLVQSRNFLPAAHLAAARADASVGPSVNQCGNSALRRSLFTFFINR